MPNEPKVYLVAITARISDEDNLRLQKLGNARNANASDVIRGIMHDALRDIEITADDMEYLLQERDKRMEKRMAKRSKYRGFLSRIFRR